MEVDLLTIPRNKLDASQVAKLMVEISTCDNPERKAKLIAYNQPPKKKTLKKKVAK